MSRRSASRAERHGFEYFQHGTLSLYAALESRRAAWPGSPQRHRRLEFPRIMNRLLLANRPTREPQVILDNLSPDQTRDVEP